MSSLIYHCTFCPPFDPPTDCVSFLVFFPFPPATVFLVSLHPYCKKKKPSHTESSQIHLHPLMIFFAPLHATLHPSSLIPPSSLFLSPTLFRSQMSDCVCVRSIRSTSRLFVEEFLQTSSSRWRGNLNCSAERACCSVPGIWALLFVISSSRNFPTSMPSGQTI